MLIKINKGKLISALCFLATFCGGPGMKRVQSMPELADLSLANEPVKMRMLV